MMDRWLDSMILVVFSNLIASVTHNGNSRGRGSDLDSNPLFDLGEKKTTKQNKTTTTEERNWDWNKHFP